MNGTDVKRADSPSASILTLALPKGRLFEQGVDLLARAGLRVHLPEKSRALRHRFVQEDGEVVLLELRNSDVPTYVDLGVADAGMVGKDVLMEAGRDVYEPLDLGFAPCRLSLIRERGATSPILRVASKYERLTAQFLRDRGLAAEVVKLSGNIELAALTGLADAVVDIVQTGSTLQANNLEEIETIMHSSARFVVNRTALKLKRERLRPLIDRLRDLVERTSTTG
ncbi:ATP phosphoribosyltransferase [Deinococcus peraridilitoris]|uniref:ATP phosphoribosyltransferase n=1 Tax=Deinococcus peraridilitoris (strain DSM 19664 / LMG 22246 / CIP 109416 / KR-200) TaxID=937777 RepID=K9ZYM5_DEIPD|nr:ATP phosphoribosyltransferase [Deinococcus peraridilitoris]AFZ66027.1 ATP phosphoribosyltransferase [Deinococcus peraridilitoris DSM 19664]